MKSKRIYIRVSETEKEEIKHYALLSGKNQSEYILDLLREDIAKKKSLYPSEKTKHRKLEAQKKEIDVWKKVPVDWCFGKVNFVIFKDDLNSNQKEITAYNVSCLEGYSEFQMITLP